jgi:hypothetical protein
MENIVKFDMKEFLEVMATRALDVRGAKFVRFVGWDYMHVLYVNSKGEQKCNSMHALLSMTHL